MINGRLFPALSHVVRTLDQMPMPAAYAVAPSELNTLHAEIRALGLPVLYRLHDGRSIGIWMDPDVDPPNLLIRNVAVTALAS